MGQGGVSVNDDPIVLKMLGEVEQAPWVRGSLIARLEEKLDGRCILVFFTSFVQPVILENEDADIIESVLQRADLKNGLTMIINSPGSDGMAAERIINICRAYTKGDFEVIVPRMAKSAATMVCFGALKIWMSQTSELGSVDTQVLRGNKLLSVYNITKSYQELLRAAVETTGHVDPYLQQLARYDASEIEELRTAQQLSESIAIGALQTGMMQGTSAEEIRAKIRPFIDPEVTLAHGRRIGLDLAQRCGLTVGEIPLQSETWLLVWELYVRTDWYVTNQASKLVQTKNHSVEMPFVTGEEAEQS
jgi:hypothetical protein